MRAKTVIIGGGAVGLSIALHSARRTDSLKDPVMLLDRGDIGLGPGARSGAVLHQFHGSKNTAGMARDSLRYYRGIENKTGRSLGFVQTGVLTLAKSCSDGHRAKLRELVSMQDSIGIDVSCVEAETMRGLIKGLDIPDDALGAWEPTAGCLDPNLAVQALCTLARNRGAIVRAQTEVLRILTEDGRVTGVETSTGIVECEQVVVASGPWSNSLLEPLGLRLPLQGMRAEHSFFGSADDLAQPKSSASSYALAGPEDSGSTGFYSAGYSGESVMDDGMDESFEDESRPLRASHPVLIDAERGFYVRCDPLHGRTTIGRRGRAGFHEVSDPDQFIDEVGDGFSAWARERLESRMPQYADVHDVGAECGLFTMSPDNQPLLGALKAVDGLHVACAFSGHSFTLAPSVGEGMAQMLSGEPVSAFETDVFSPERFLNE